MSPSLHLTVTEPELIALAKAVAANLSPGDCIVLRGDLGAGKTTFARALIRALLADPTLEVPSPTFALRQDYTAAAGPIVHFDFYRVSDARDVDELGFEESLREAITIIEWPERAETLLPPDRIEIELSDSRSPSTRNVKISGHGAAVALVAAIAGRTTGPST